MRLTLETFPIDAATIVLVVVVTRLFERFVTVIVTVLVDESGAVTQSRVVRGVEQNVGINEAALEAAKTARFEPATKDGVRVKVWYTFSMPFRL